MQAIMENRQARHLYHIEDELEAGLVLEGWEVKAILSGRANFNGGGAYVVVTETEAWLEHMTITPLPTVAKGLLFTPNPGRTRKLLLTKCELKKLAKKVGQRGYTVVPLSVQRGRKLKLVIGLAKGKTHADKRETIKNRDLVRDAQRAID